MARQFHKDDDRNYSYLTTKLHLTTQDNTKMSELGKKNKEIYVKSILLRPSLSLSYLHLNQKMRLLPLCFLFWYVNIKRIYARYGIMSIVWKCI